MKRLISGLVLATILVATVWSTTPYFFLVFSLLVLLIALREFYGLVEKTGYQCYSWLGYGASLAICYAFATERFTLIPPVAFVLLLLIMISVLLTSRSLPDFSKVVGSASGTLFGVFYVSVCAGHLIAVRMLDPQGTAHLPSKLLTVFFLIIAASDTGAYYFGSYFGQHKLAPLISPGKTWEGSIGGLMLAISVALIAKYTFFPEIPALHALLLAMVMNIVGQMGDLFESIIKRGARTKDTASLIPGHGGLLDRIDSILFNAPLLYYYYQFYFGS
jgi:phosphatidate cytidylyltransferase